jgi:hypothetical protein
MPNVKCESLTPLGFIMYKNLLDAHTGLALIVLSVTWSVAGPWLSANKFITVGTELTFSLLCFLVMVFGAVIYFLNLGELKLRLGIGIRGIVGICAFLAVAALLLSSNRMFFFWKLRAIPSSAWSEMVLELEKTGKESIESGTNDLAGTKAPPKSLQQLGLGNDYVGGSAHSGDFGNKGIIVNIEFGNKVRVWGLRLGPEKALIEFRPNCRFVRVGQNAFFYVGSN